MRSQKNERISLTMNFRLSDVKKKPYMYQIPILDDFLGFTGLEPTRHLVVYICICITYTCNIR